MLCVAIGSSQETGDQQTGQLRGTGYRDRTVALPFVRKFFTTGEDVRKNTAMFPSSRVPDNFKTMLFKCARHFSRVQIKTMETNIDARGHTESAFTG